MSQTAQSSLFPAKQPSVQEPWPLPSGWEWVPLGELCKAIVGGGTPDRGNPRYWGGNILWASVKDLKSDELASTQESITPEGLENSAARVVEPGTIVLATRMGLGKVCVAQARLAINQDLKGLILRSNVLSQYVVFFLKSRASDIEGRGTGATVKGVKLEELKAWPVPVPFPQNHSRSFDIQRRIVTRIETLLAEVKEARALASAIRRDTNRLLDAAVHEVFTSLYPVANIVLLKKVATACNGRASGEGNSPVRVFKTKHVYPHCLRLDRPSFMKPEQVQQLPRDRYLKPGDVLMANIAEGTLGRVSYVQECEESWTVDTQIMILRSLDDRNTLLGKWLYYYLWSEQGQYEILARRSGIAFADKRGQTHIYPKNVLEIPVPVPPIEKQIQAVALLDNVQTETEEMCRLQTQDVELLDQLEQSLLERAFRGEL